MFNFAIGNLWSRPLRSLLSLVGLAVAIGGMVTLFAIAGGIKHVVKNTFDQIPGMLVQQRGAPIPLFSTLPASWEEEIRKLEGVAVVDPQVIARINLLDEKPVFSPPRFLVGVNLETRQHLSADLYRDKLVDGRMLEIQDAGTTRCVISQAIADETGKKVGEAVRLNGFDAPIVGIYSIGSVMLDVNVLMDSDVVREKSRIAPDAVACFYVEPHENADKKKVKQSIEDLFRNREVDAFRNRSSSSEGSFSFLVFLQTVSDLWQASANPVDQNSNVSAVDPVEENSDAVSGQPESYVEVRMAEDWAERFAEFSGDLELILALITAVGLLIAVLSIVNTMMMSVTERTIEFGILQANGWSQSNIITLMVLEAGVLGALGGTIGVVLGKLATHLINWNWPNRLQLHASPELLLFALGLSVVMGVLAGLYPAWIASRLSPMESIRRG